MLREYFEFTRRPLYSFIFVLPLLVVYETLILLMRSDIRNGADVLTKSVLHILGIHGLWSLTLVLASGFAVVVWKDTGKKTQVKPLYFLFMLFESNIYAVFLAPVIFRLMHPFSSPTFERFPLCERIVLSIGAGVYEEFVFRLFMISIFTFLFVKITKISKKLAMFWAVLISSIIFSAFHYIGQYGDIFTVQSFMFRFLAGIIFSVLYVVRGYGITVYTHAIYDIYISLNLI